MDCWQRIAFARATASRWCRAQIYELRIPLRHCAYAIAAGHRLRVAIASAEFQNAWPTGQPARNTIHRGGAACVAHRAAGRAATAAAAGAGIRAVTASAAVSGDAGPARLRFHLDLVNDTVTCELRAPDGGRTSNHSRYTVSNRDPART